MSRPLGFIKFMPKKIMDRSIPLRHEKKNSHLSGIERSIIFLGVSIRCEKKIEKKNKENFILMDSRLSGLELCMSIRCENFRRENFRRENFRYEN